MEEDRRSGGAAGHDAVPLVSDQVCQRLPGRESGAGQPRIADRARCHGVVDVADAVSCDYALKRDPKQLTL